MNSIKEFEKEKCCECSSIAIWFYPSSSDSSPGNYCDEHVPREGCSCNLNEAGEFYKDERGRDLPCVDYMYFEEGINK